MTTKITPDDQAVLHELWAAHQLLCSLGFPSDNLYTRQALDNTRGPYSGKQCVALELRWHKKTFVYTIAPVSDFKAFGKAWVAFIQNTNEGRVPEEVLKQIYTKSFAFEAKVQLIAAMLAKGIKSPCDNN